MRSFPAFPQVSEGCRTSAAPDRHESSTLMAEPTTANASQVPWRGPASSEERGLYCRGSTNECVGLSGGRTSSSGGIIRRIRTLARANGGEGGIRTHGTVARTTVFETAPIDHSGTSPQLGPWSKARGPYTAHPPAASGPPGLREASFDRRPRELSREGRSSSTSRAAGMLRGGGALGWGLRFEPRRKSATRRPSRKPSGRQT